jgi:pilus assembly protein CpaB
VTRRILIIGLAIVLAVIGTGAVLIYAKGADQRALSGQKAVSVLVATQRIPAGTSAGTALTNGMLSKQKLPASSVPADAIRSLTPGLKPLVMSSSIAPGELLLRPVLVTAVASTSGVAIPSGMMAVTIAMCVPEAVARYVYPGAEVAVFDTVIKVGSAQWSCGSKPVQLTDKTKTVTRIVLTRVKVLSVNEAAPVNSAGQVTSTAFGQSTSSGTTDQATQNEVMVTLAVNQADAERVINLGEAGLPYLALLTKSSVTGPDPAKLPSLFPPAK